MGWDYCSYQQRLLGTFTILLFKWLKCLESIISLCMSKSTKKCGCRSQIKKDCITLLNCNMAYIGATLEATSLIPFWPNLVHTLYIHNGLGLLQLSAEVLGPGRGACLPHPTLKRKVAKLWFFCCCHFESFIPLSDSDLNQFPVLTYNLLPTNCSVLF
jgi:hypothetical protein